MKAELLLESHVDPWEDPLVYKHAESMFKSTTGNVLLALEAGMQETHTINISNMVAEGFLPSAAFTLRSLPILQARMFKNVDLSKTRGDDGNRVPEEFINYDRFMAYKDEEGNPRLRILLEGNRAFTELGPYDVQDYLNRQRHVIKNLEEGDIRKALQYYKENTILQAGIHKKREDLFVDKIMDNLDGVEGLVIRFGAAHTRIQHLLHRAGVDTHKLFIVGAETTNFLFDPELAAMRKVMMKGEETVTEFEWKKSMYGDLIFRLYQSLLRTDKAESIGTYSYNEVVLESVSAMRRIKTPAQMDEFETIFSHRGLQDAIGWLLEN